MACQRGEENEMLRQQLEDERREQSSERIWRGPHYSRYGHFFEVPVTCSRCRREEAYKGKAVQPVEQRILK